IPPSLVVPNPAAGKWLRMRLVEGNLQAGQHPEPFGCVAGLEMQTLERFLWNVLKPCPDMELLDVDRLRHLVFALLDEHDGPLHDYVSASPGKAGNPLKRIQVSAKIASQFLEYEYNRPSVWDETKKAWRRQGIDASWISGKSYFETGAQHEEWQKRLYRKVHTTLSSSRRYLSLPHLYRRRREECAGGNALWADPPGHIFLFGVTKVSHFHRNVLVEISQMDGVEIALFLTNPCAEFWEDVDTRRTRTVRRSWKHDSADAGITARKPEDYDKEKLSDIATLPEDHQLLERWGAAGKENIFLWCPQAHWNFEYHRPVEGGESPATLLSAVQRSLLQGRNRLQERNGGWPDDGSLTVLACPDRGREIETLREQVLDLIAEKKIDRLNEVAVFLPDPGAYMPYIERVFGSCRPGEPDYIPVTVLGAPGSGSLFSQGVRTILEMAGGLFDRPHVFALLRNPLVGAVRGISVDHVALWERWAGDLGVYRGFNREHRRDMGDRGECITDVHTFGFGSARLLIGGLASGPIELDYFLPGGSGEDAQRMFVPPLRDFDTADHGTVEEYCSIVEELYEDLRELGKTGEQIDIDAGVAALAGMVGKWLGNIPDDAGVDGRAEAGMSAAFLGSLKSMVLQKEPAGRDALPFEEFLLMAESCLAGELPGASAAWTGGITFAPLRPAMIVPHRVIFAAGLDAAAFPGTADRPGWDLLSQQRIVGDSDRVSDNRFAFLELLHAARERLVLSFRARDMQKEEELQPASVVLELESYLASQGVERKEGGTGCCGIRHDVPWIVHESLRVAGVDGRMNRSWDSAEIALARRAGEPGRKVHRFDLPSGRSDARAVPSSGVPLRTDFYHLRTFFTNPLEYHLSKTLGIELDEEEATSGASDEPLSSGAFAESSLRRMIWKKVLARVFPKEKGDEASDPAALAVEAQDAAGRMYDEHVARGRSPEAPFCRMEKQELGEWARECAATTLDLRGAFDDHWLWENAGLSLGREGMPDELSVNLDGGGVGTIGCRHRLVLLPRSPANKGGCVGIVEVKKEGKARENQTLWLAGALQWMVEKEAPGRMNIVLVQLNRGDGKKSRTGFDCLKIRDRCDNGSDIDAWLSGMLDEMLVKKCSDHLPFTVIQRLFKGEWNAITAEAVSGELEGNYSVYRCRLEAFKLSDARLPRVSDEELRKRSRERFAPLLEGWLHE
ncbi:MAG: exodeoxyribonuclease V subunit gamma, partial [Chitinispirillaceae bacterium]|nr:exodeoxyribonuclease V subunit gamma [Chitinispirillaceae bacterium]